MRTTRSFRRAVHSVLTIGLGLGLWWGCGTTPDATDLNGRAGLEMPEVDGGELAKLDKTRFFTRPIVAKGLLVWPILATEFPEIGEFLTLAEAEEKGFAEVRERGPAGGQAQGNYNLNGSDLGQNGSFNIELPSAVNLNGVEVQVDAEGQAPAQVEIQEQVAQGPEQEAVQLLGNDVDQVIVIEGQGASATVSQIVIENKGDKPILVCGGTIVKGGNQDRQIAQDFVIQPKTTVPVDAFCIEQGRWDNAREGQLTNGVFKTEGKIAAKAVRTSAVYENDQGAVWSNVQKINDSFGKSPQTGTFLATIEEDDESAVSYRKELTEGISQHFAALRSKGHHAVGFAYAINGKPETVRVFAHPRLLADHLDDFAETIAVEADLARRGAKDDVRSCELNDVLAMVEKINEAQEKIATTSSVNQNGVRMNGFGGNFNCYLPTGDGAPASARNAGIAVTQDWTSK